MLKFKMVEEKQDIIKYEYYPEGKEACGIVSINKVTGEMELVKQAENDRRGNYARKMFGRILKMLQAGTFDEAGMIAWY